MRYWTYENEQWTKLPTYLKHLPLFTRHLDITSIFVRYIWAFFLQDFFFKTYIRLKVAGNSFHDIYRDHPKLIIISNHASHLDAISIAAAIPKKYWFNLYIAAAKDYFFTNPLFTFFSQHCLGAIPIDRKDKKGEAINLILKLLTDLQRMWLIIFPEGTRSKDGKIQEFKRGISIFSERTKTPLLFIYIDGNLRLWPKGHVFAKPGVLTIHVGEVHPPGPINEVYEDYKKWVKEIDPTVEFSMNENTESLPVPTEEENQSESHQH